MNDGRDSIKQDTSACGYITILYWPTKKPESEYKIDLVGDIDSKS